MSTRPKKPPTTEHPPEASIDVGGQQGATNGKPQGQENMAELSSLLRCLMQQQADRDSRADQERSRQEERWKCIQHQFAQLQQEVQQDRQDRQRPMEGSAAMPTSSTELIAEPLPIPAIQDRPDADAAQLATGEQHSSFLRFSGWKSPKMQPYNEGEDIEHYLITFERIAHACQWPQEEWALRLAPLLTGKARSAYVAMDIDDTMDYTKVKYAVLQKLDLPSKIPFQCTRRGGDAERAAGPPQGPV